MQFLFLVLLILTAPRRGRGTGLAAGGSECAYRFDYVDEMGAAAFSARAVFNATGFFNAAAAYKWFEDGEMGACAGEEQLDETGVSSFSFNFRSDRYAAPDNVTLHYAHFPIGIKYHELGPVGAMFGRFFVHFSFETADGAFYPCCIDAPCRCVCNPFVEGEGGEDIRVFCIESVAPLNCTNDAPPVSRPSAVLALRPDGDVITNGENGDWFAAYPWVLANGTDRHESVVRNEIIYRDQFDIPVNYTEAMCRDPEYGGGCLFLRPGGSVRSEVFMGPALGQAQRMAIEVDYWTLPESDGDGLCVYFDYDGADMQTAIFKAVPTLNRAWCGRIAGHDGSHQTLRIDLPLTYGPAHSGIEYESQPAQGYSRSRPIAIEARARTSVVLYDVRVISSGKAYHCLDRDWDVRRRGAIREEEEEYEPKTVSGEPAWWKYVNTVLDNFNDN